MVAATEMAERREAPDVDAFSFSASGWLMQWQLGVAYSLQRVGFDEWAKTRYVGASGGSAVSATMALGVDAKLISDFMVRCLADYHKNPARNMFKMREYAKECVRRCMDESTHTHEALRSGRLNVQISLLPAVRGVVVNQFDSADHYLKCIMASCTMSPFAGMPFQMECRDPNLNGAWVFDGGLTAIVPTLGDDTITVCPLYFMDADIKPSRFIPLHWGVFPPSMQDFIELFWLGAHDGMAWLHQHGHAKLASDPRDMVQYLQRQQSFSRKEWRIKPMQRRAKVSSRSSFDVPRPGQQGHGDVLEIIELGEQQQRHHGMLARDRSGSWSSFDSADTSASLVSTESARVQRVLLQDAAKAGEPMSWPRESVSRVGDSVIMAAASTCVKPLALGIVYTELWSRAAVSAANAAVAHVESKRRASKPSKGGWLSLRRWVHEDMLGSAAESWESATSYVSAAANPAALLAHVPLVGSRIIKEEDAKAANRKIEQHSYSYRLLSRASLI
ncbi:Patatin-like phospholipase domain-containing protein 2 [Hondaea fermentalgiana]|uniref:Patatin-like phospholipase domain-containing protein 2 n=1 Tax=Hondaea fermentalgiana TaxID=2315210 RepID=A0A2R5GGH6_9STRA|nr:Patatin-like phospholipase domain-containing protein 2 [Hondaea fermentalgiana]|eukprot:GBG28858.1 Patatin-like phospholipase domain-containing protein 2 [Hondaea fermentalgiana]